MGLLDKYPDLVDNNRVMNGMHEYYEPDGAQLRDGMVVMLSNPSSRWSFKTLRAEDTAKIIITNRWCKVACVYVRGNYVSFMAEYEDGATVPRKYEINEPWMVKRNSVGRKSPYDSVMAKDGYSLLHYASPQETVVWLKKQMILDGLTVNVGTLGEIVPVEDYLFQNASEGERDVSFEKRTNDQREQQMFSEMARLGIKSSEVQEGTRAESYLKKRKQIEEILLKHGTYSQNDLWVDDALDEIMKKFIVLDI